MKRYTVTIEMVNRYIIIKEWEKGKIKGKEVSEILGISLRHAFRLKKKVREKGFESLNDIKGRGRKKIRREIKREVARLYDVVYDRRLNILHFKDKLIEYHNIKLSYESIRKILIESGLYEPKRRKKNFHRRRIRMPKEGMLIQMDSSYHEWIEGKGKRFLIAMIDDATNEVLYGRFYEKDTTYNNMEAIKEVIKKKGCFMALYVDKASHFKTTRIGGVHYDVSEEQKETNIEEALEELGITLITANSPQAKGRIERLFGFFQDRLINEMWIRKIKDYEEANRYLVEEFIPWYNARYTHKAEGSVYREKDKKNLDLIFTKRYNRRVNRDNTISIFREKIQLNPTGRRLNFARAIVQVRISKENKVWILYNGEVILETKISENNDMIRKERTIEEILKERTYV